MVRLVFLILILATSGMSLGQGTGIDRLISRLKTLKEIVRIQEEKLPPPPPQRSSERKFLIWAKNTDDEVFPYIVFLAAPKGQRFFNLVSIRFENSPSFERALYGFGFLVGVFESICLGLQEPTINSIRAWTISAIEKIQQNGSGQFNRSFGPVTVDLAGYQVFDIGELLIAYTRQDTPGKSWTRWCTY